VTTHPEKEIDAMFKRVTAAALAGLLTLSLAACGEEEETAGEELGDAMEKAGEQVEEAAEQAGDEMEEATDEMDN
jgi:uncharacterized lipoprotein YehR (DUF1307 family)